MCGVRLSACARGSSHDNPMGVSHRFRGIGSDCCYLDPTDEDTRDTRGVPDPPRGLSATITSMNLQSIIPPRAFVGKPSSALKSLKCPLVSIDFDYVFQFKSDKNQMAYELRAR